MIRLGLLALLLVLAGCTGEAGEPTASTSTRPPLDSPPDPGPIPAEHGVDPDLVERVGASTVRITGIACGRQREGSGFAVTGALVVTNAHVVLGVEHPMLHRPDERPIPAGVVAFDAVNDLALLHVDDVEFTPLPLGDADDGTVGAVFGWEPGPELEVTPFRVDRPVVVSIDAVGSDERVDRDAYLVAAEIEAGDSGAPLVDASGTVIGVALGQTVHDSSAAYAVRTAPISRLLDAGIDEAPARPDCSSS